MLDVFYEITIQEDNKSNCISKFLKNGFFRMWNYFNTVRFDPLVLFEDVSKTFLENISFS